MDFGKIYQRQERGRGTSRKKSSSFSRVLRKTVFFLSVITISFTVGLGSGLLLSPKNSASLPALHNELRSSNIAESPKLQDDVLIDQPPVSVSAQPQSPQNSMVQPQDKAVKETYLILANVYDDSNRAHKAGLELKKNGLPVFLATSGKRMKLYVGPMEGENKARDILTHLKKMPNFEGATLYRK